MQDLVGDALLTSVRQYRAFGLRLILMATHTIDQSFLHRNRCRNRSRKAIRLEEAVNSPNIRLDDHRECPLMRVSSCKLIWVKHWGIFAIIFLSSMPTQVPLGHEQSSSYVQNGSDSSNSSVVVSR